MKVPSMKYIDNMSQDDRKKYAGRWIVVVDDRVVHHARSAEDVRKTAARHDDRGDMPVVQYIPEDASPFLL